MEGMVDAMRKKIIKIKGAKKDDLPDRKNFKFKKGKENPFVDIVKFNEQYDRVDSKPDFSCCISCNNQEIVRAIKTNDFDLLKNIIREAEKNNCIEKV